MKYNLKTNQLSDNTFCAEICREVWIDGKEYLPDVDYELKYEGITQGTSMEGYAPTRWASTFPIAFPITTKKEVDDLVTSDKAMGSDNCDAPLDCNKGIEQFKDRVLKVIYENQEAMKRAKAEGMDEMEIFETDNMYDAVINTYEDLFEIITTLNPHPPEPINNSFNLKK